MDDFVKRAFDVCLCKLHLSSETEAVWRGCPRALLGELLRSPGGLQNNGKMLLQLCSVLTGVERPSLFCLPQRLAL